jgi:hypothetical protein
MEQDVRYPSSVLETSKRIEVCSTLWISQGYEAVVKKRFRKKHMYTQDDRDLRLLAPFDDGTIVEGEVVEELIFVNFITGPELGIRMSSLTYIEEYKEMCEVLDELGPSIDTMSKPLAIMELHGR